MLWTLGYAEPSVRLTNIARRSRPLTPDHSLGDVHPLDFSKTLFPGQDYNNARIGDFNFVKNYVGNTLSVLEAPRMPWHDVHMTLSGPVVLDIVQHYTERWNEVKTRKVRYWVISTACIT